MKTVELIKRKGSVAIVKFQDAKGVTQCGIIDVDLVKGKTFEVFNKVVETATPYGVDWSIVYPHGLVVEADAIQEALYGLGIYTIDDVRRNTNGVISAINSILRITNAKLLDHARKTLNVGGM